MRSFLTPMLLSGVVCIFPFEMKKYYSINPYKRHHSLTLHVFCFSNWLFYPSSVIPLILFIYFILYLYISPRSNKYAKSNNKYFKRPFLPFFMSPVLSIIKCSAFRGQSSEEEEAFQMCKKV